MSPSGTGTSQPSQPSLTAALAALVILAVLGAACTGTQRQSAPAGLLTVAGRITGEGVECLALRGTDGTLYTLAGDTAGAGVGDEVVVQGRPADVSVCMQGTTLEVRAIRRR